MNPKMSETAPFTLYARTYIRDRLYPWLLVDTETGDRTTRSAIENDQLRSRYTAEHAARVAKSARAAA